MAQHSIAQIDESQCLNAWFDLFMQICIKKETYKTNFNGFDNCDILSICRISSQIITFYSKCLILKKFMCVEFK